MQAKLERSDSSSRRNINSGASGDSLIAAFAKFSTEHPGFVIYSQLDAVTVISVQSSLMRSQLVKERLLEGPINGLVSDAAHGWWLQMDYLPE